jgi:hypothetical protein
MTNNCRSCGAPIVWAVTEATGRRMPIDPEPTSGGNVILSDDNPPVALVLPAGQASLFAHGTGADRFTSHFATCPNADAHRKAAR